MNETASTKRPRAPGLLNAGIVAVVVSLVAAVALTARQQPPPTVAEFAPQAVEQIRESLPEQADAPAAAGGQPADEAGDDPEDVSEDDETVPEELDEEAPIERARVHRCVGDPPRQTEDPQSPPCVPYFDGDNGGATWQGVTADEIRIAVPRQVFGAPNHVLEAFAAHFNQRYEFYGRRMVLEFFEPTGGTFAQPNPPDMIADAVHVDEELQAFATIGYGDRKGSEHHYYEELARRGVISSAFRLESLGTADRYASHHPYRWNFAPSIDTLLANLGDFTCRTLAHQPPQGGGVGGDGQGSPLDAVGGDTDRVFGLVYLRPPDGSLPPLDILRRALAGCGVELAADVEDDWTAPNGNNVVLRMAEAGVTSVIYIGDPGPIRVDYMNAATNQGYFPEWIVSTYIDLDLDNVFQPGTAPPEQTQNVLGISTRNRLLPRQHMPWYWALREILPEEDPQGGNYYPMMARYGQLLQLASGIQLAGPELTPETFARGLQSAVFPNPGAGGPPYFQAAVDYRGRHTAVDSTALYYYSTQDGGTIDSWYPGAVCYVDQGVRYRVGSYPSSPQAFFQAPCR